MTIASTIRKAGPYTGNGVTTSFPFSFKLFATTDLVVTQTSLLGLESVLLINTDYTVFLNANQDSAPGGTITTTVAPATGILLTLSSGIPLVQPVLLTNNGGFYPTVINDALDRVTILIQQMSEQLSRSAKVPISGIGSLTANTLVFGVDISGNPVISKLTDITTSLLSVSMAAFLAGGQFISTLAGNLANGAGQIYLNGTGSNRIDFNSNGSAAPSFTTRSLGTKITLLNGITGVSTDIGLGIESVGMWSSVPTTGNAFKWYGGTTVVATLSGTGQFTTLSDITSGAGLTSTSPTGGVGYATGAGGSVTQLTSKVTGVTLNKICGIITTANDSLASGSTAVFLLNNSTIGATDMVNVSFLATGSVQITNFSLRSSTVSTGGACYIALKNESGGPLSTVIQILFSVQKVVNA
jgi:hypothetical protein